MSQQKIDRRTILKAATALAATGMAPGLLFAQPRNVDTVIADGRILRRGGRFTALDHAEVLKEAAETVAALRARANWL